MKFVTNQILFNNFISDTRNAKLNLSCKKEARIRGEVKKLHNKARLTTDEGPQEQDVWVDDQDWYCNDLSIGQLLESVGLGPIQRQGHHRNPGTS